jgi:hypothetical protein
MAVDEWRNNNCISFLKQGYTTERKQKDGKEISLALAMTYDVNAEGVSGISRDTIRLKNYWGDMSAGVAVSIVEKEVTISPRYLRYDFTGRNFIKKLEEHVKKFKLGPCIGEIYLDYMWMPDVWAVTNYGKNFFHLLENIRKLAESKSPSIHIKEGGVVFLPTPWKLYHGFVTSTYWKDLIRFYRVDYIKYEEAQSNPLVSSDMKIKEVIARYGKDMDMSLDLLKLEGEQNLSLETEDLQYWRGNDDIFVRLTRKTRGS